MNKKSSNWLFAFALMLPMVVFFVAYLVQHDAALVPSGFIQYDNVSYIAYAQQYLDSEHFQLLYNNPFNDSGNYPGIYFQFHTLFFALLLKLGVPAGAILIPFTLACSIVCFRLVIAIYDSLFPTGRGYRQLSIWLFAWGGGLLALAGYIAKLLIPSVDSIFYFDPAAGWWGLNFGRSLFFSCEAFYHLLFLAVIYSLLKKKWGAVVLLLLATGISHPFTGIEILTITTSWLLTETLLIKKDNVPIWATLSSIALLALHLYYYLYYLPGFADHESVNQQYALNWRLRYFTMIPAYLPVAILAITSFARVGFARFFNARENRLFFVWFLIAFLLANHELFITPRQPLHFTRGYIWTPLFLMGLPGLHFFLDRIKKMKLGIWLMFAGLLLLFSDNIAWITAHTVSKATEPSVIYPSKEQVQLLETMKKYSDRETLIISRDEVTQYMCTIYTSGYPSYSHPFTTPFAERKKEALMQFFETGIMDPSWKGRKILVVVDKNELQPANWPATTPLMETANYRLVAINNP